MKLIPLNNVSGQKLRIVEARLVFEPGQEKKVHPATVKHPAVLKYIKRGWLTQGTQETIEKAEPKAPVAPQAQPPVAPPQDPTEPNAGTEDGAPEGNDEITPESTEAALEDASVDSAEEGAEDDDDASDDQPSYADPEVTVADAEGSGNLRELYLSAPGITDNNVDAVLQAFESVELLAAASKSDLLDVGVSKNSAKKVLGWAKDQL